MSCGEWTESLSAFVDGELVGDELHEVESHLSHCSRCSQWVGQAEDLRRRMLIRVPIDTSGAAALVRQHHRSGAQHHGANTQRLRTRVQRVAGAAAAVVLVAGLALLTLASTTNGAGSAVATGAQPEQTIETDTASFDRATVTVEPGDTVRWVNTSNIEHRLVRDDGDSVVASDLEPGGSEEVTFAAPGAYEFHCTIHPSMHGTVTVRS
ncbi:MAG: cupredoxin domain-containing protein [Microthrixaceae bacterium]|nr:cupredoxin domain-containing protein [Microthrixaceae bacterium]MCO5319085.1 cupredoxin domain-containing protein [Microthrixaceae bacterium]